MAMTHMQSRAPVLRERAHSSKLVGSVSHEKSPRSHESIGRVKLSSYFYFTRNLSGLCQNLWLQQGDRKRNG